MAYFAMGSVGSRITPRRVVARGQVFADDAPPEPVSEGETPESVWRGQMLASQREMVEWQKRWVTTDERQRWIQIGATLAIPLAAAVWRAILGRRGKIELD